MINEQMIEKAATTTSEILGNLTSPLASGVLGALLGGGLGALGGHGRGSDIGAGLMLGGGVGAGLGQLANSAGPLAALITPSSTDEDMKERGRSSLLDYLIPGHASYALFKRLGHSQNKYDR